MNIDELKRCRALRGDVESLKERIARLESAMEGCAARTGDGVSGGETDRLASGVAQLCELRERLVAKVVALERQIATCEAEVDKLPEQQRRVLRLRYFDGLSWRQVARKCGYVESHVFHIHRRALSRLENNVSSK